MISREVQSKVQKERFEQTIREIQMQSMKECFEQRIQDSEMKSVWNRFRNNAVLFFQPLRQQREFLNFEQEIPVLYEVIFVIALNTIFVKI